MKKPKKSVLFTLGYSLAIIAWFSYSSLSGIDMLAYSKDTTWKASGSGAYSKLHHK